MGSNAESSAQLDALHRHACPTPSRLADLYANGKGVTADGRARCSLRNGRRQGRRVRAMQPICATPRARASRRVRRGAQVGRISRPPTATAEAAKSRDVFAKLMTAEQVAEAIGSRANGLRRHTERSRLLALCRRDALVFAAAQAQGDNYPLTTFDSGDSSARQHSARTTCAGTAFRWITRPRRSCFRSAAEQGDAGAQNALVLLHAADLGVAAGLRASCSLVSARGRAGRAGTSVRSLGDTRQRYRGREDSAARRRMVRQGRRARLRRGRGEPGLPISRAPACRRTSRRLPPFTPARGPGGPCQGAEQSRADVHAGRGLARLYAARSRLVSQSRRARASPCDHQSRRDGRERFRREAGRGRGAPGLPARRATGGGRVGNGAGRVASSPIHGSRVRRTRLPARDSVKAAAGGGEPDAQFLLAWLLSAGPTAERDPAGGGAAPCQERRKKATPPPWPI